MVEQSSGTPMTREEAWKLLNEYTSNPSLTKHMLAVEAAMRALHARGKRLPSGEIEASSSS